MTISAKVIADSISPEGIRLTTMQLRYPRFIHAEFMTHRMFSRNASSSRAIPVKKMIEDLRRDPAMPIHWGSNKPGMQAGDEIPEQDFITTRGGGKLPISPRKSAQERWLDSMEEAISAAQDLMLIGLHKQIANRILEPWAHINVVVTATNWENFYALRRHEDAQPEIKALADAMWEAQQASVPDELQPGDWHLPYIDYAAMEATFEARGEEEWRDVLKKVSVARCARVSYLTHDGRQTTVEEDLQLYDRLVGSSPLHASPAEHQATPDTPNKYHVCLAEDGNILSAKSVGFDNPDLHGNFRGWIQYRKTLPDECVDES